MELQSCAIRFSTARLNCCSCWLYPSIPPTKFSLWMQFASVCNIIDCHVEHTPERKGRQRDARESVKFSGKVKLQFNSNCCCKVSARGFVHFTRKARANRGSGENKQRKRLMRGTFSRWFGGGAHTSRWIVYTPSWFYVDCGREK